MAYPGKENTHDQDGDKNVKQDSGIDKKRKFLPDGN